MEQDNSTGKEEKKPRRKKYAKPRISLEFAALLARLRYVGDFVFGGDLNAYAKAVGLTEHWLKYILDDANRVRVSAFTQFVTSGLVSAEWLFCGTGPMLMPNVVVDEINGFIPAKNIDSRYTLLDTAAMAPLKMPQITLASCPQVEHNSVTSQRIVSIARQIFISSTNRKPVILFLNADAVISDVASIVASMLQKKYVTGIALTLPAAEIDYQLSGQADTTCFNDVIIQGARAGIGLGEALGSFIAGKIADPAKSILAAAYLADVPITVHGSIGESPMHFSPSKRGAEFGAAYGATSYVDSLIFAEQVRQMAGDKMSLFLNVGSSLPGLPLLSSAMTAAQDGLRLSFNHLKISRLTARQVANPLDVHSPLDVCVCGPYQYLMSSIFDTCNVIFEGNFDVRTSSTSGEQFATFGCSNKCAKGVCDSAASKCKRKG